MKVSRKAKMVLVSAVAVLAVGYGVLLRPQNPTTVQAEEASVSRSLKPGQTRTDVEQYLRQRGLTFSYVDGST